MHGTYQFPQPSRAVQVDSHGLADAFEQIFEAMPWPVLLFDSDSNVLAASDERLQHASRDASSHDHPIRARAAHYLETLLPGGGPWPAAHDAECMRTALSGRVVHERLHLRRTRWGACVSIVDITVERQQQTVDLQTTRLAALGFMVAGVCHEVTNPLTSLQSIVQLMRSEQPLSQTLLTKGLDNIAVNVKRILEISRRLVRFSRVGDDPRTGFAVDDAMREALLGVRQQGALGAIEVRHQGDTGSMIYGNRGQIQQIFVNLFSNAVQAMSGEGVLQVEQRRIGNYVEVLVIDSGPGVAPESVGRIFEPFFTTKSSTHGTGLGLSVSAEIAREHGGSIELRRNGADGATFCVALPAYRQ